MSFSETIFSLADLPFYIGDFAAVKKDVPPPTPYICSDNLVLYERFFYVVKGTIVFDDEVHHDLRFSAGDIVYLPSNVTYRSYWDTAEPGRFLSLNFVLYDANHQVINLADDLMLASSDPSGRLYEQFSEVFSLWERSAKGYKLACCARLMSIMHQIAQNAQTSEIGREKRGITRAVLYLEDHYLTNVTVDELVALTGLHECQFRRSFKRLKGTSPIHYRNLLRLEKAAEILRSSDYSVVETSMIVGFDDPSYFSRLFKARYGMSPSEYAAK